MQDKITIEAVQKNNSSLFMENDIIVCSYKVLG